MSKTLVILDCDGVLLDWETPYFPWAKESGHNPLDRYSIVDFNMSKGFAKLAPCPGAVDMVKRLSRDGCELRVLSACGTDPQIVVKRWNNLLSVFGDVFASIECIPLGESKVDSFIRFVKGNTGRTILVEDTLHHALVGANCGMESYLLRTAWNRGERAVMTPSMNWIDDLSEVLAERS